jgi:hypothetical protein
MPSLFAMMFDPIAMNSTHQRIQRFFILSGKGVGAFARRQLSIHAGLLVPLIVWQKPV